jgi:hypothetical protein
MSTSPVVALVPVQHGPHLPAPWQWWDGDGHIRLPTHDPFPAQITGEADSTIRIPRLQVLWSADERLREIGPRYWMRPATGGLGHAYRRYSEAIARGDQDPSTSLEGLWTDLDVATLYATRDEPLWVPPNVLPGTEYAAPGPRPQGHTWLQVTVAVRSTWENRDGRWWEPAGRSWWNGTWWNPSQRIARASVGTPLPQGWTIPDTAPWLAEAAPAGYTFDRAFRDWDRAQSSPMRLVSATAAKAGRGWHAWRGNGSLKTQVGSNWPTREVAVEAAKATIERDREQLLWVAAVLTAGLPAIEAIV